MRWVRAGARSPRWDAARGRWVLPAAMLFGSFAWSFVYVSLPFHIQRLSPLDTASTLRWTGWILGVSSLVTVTVAPLWGRWAERGNAKALYVAVEAMQGLTFLTMALARTLLELFLVRLVLGVVGAASTFAFIIAGRAGEPRAVRRQIAAVQSAMTVGQVIGPLAGAIAAARLGFRASFVLGGLILFGCVALVQWGVPRGEPVAPSARTAGAVPAREAGSVALIVLGGSTQIFFLASILPQVLPGFGIASAETLEVGGILIFVSGVAAALGALATARLGDWLPERWLIAGLLAASSLLSALLALAGSVWLFGALRFLQVLAIAPVFPIVVSRIAPRAGGSTIGFVNSARIGAAFVGPVLATTLLAWTSPWAVYVVLGAIGALCVPLAMRYAGPPRPAP